MLPKKTSSSRFILEGFSQDQGFRQFAFEAADGGRVRTQFTVRADLTLARAYGIQIQDLPLLCLELLERRSVAEDARRLTFTEDDMRLHQAGRLAAQLAAAQKRLASSRRTPSEKTGNTWRAKTLHIASGA